MFAHSPEVEVISEGQDTHGILDMQFPSPVEVQDGIEGSGMAVKEVSRLFYFKRTKYC